MLATTLLSGLALTACGSSSNASTGIAAGGGATPAAAGGFAANRTKLAACLKQQGVTLPTGFGAGRPGAGGPGGGAVPPGGVPGGPPSGATGGAGFLFGGGRRFGASGRFGTSGRFGPSGRFGFARNPKAAAAFQTCAKQLGLRFGASGRFGPSGRFGAANAAQFRQRELAALQPFIACVKKHGFTLPALSTTGGSLLPQSLQSDKKFLAAAKPCESLIPRFGFGGAAAGGPPGAPA